MRGLAGAAVILGGLAPEELQTYASGPLVLDGTTLRRSEEIVTGYSGPPEWPELVVFLPPVLPDGAGPDRAVGYVFTPERTWVLFDPAVWSGDVNVLIDGIPADRQGGLASLPGDHAWATAMVDDRELSAESEDYLEELWDLRLSGATVEELEAWVAENPPPESHQPASSQIAIATALRPPDLDDLHAVPCDEIPETAPPEDRCPSELEP